MNASEFLEYLRIQRVKVHLVNGQLQAKAPPGVLTDWERAQLARLKPEIIALLSGAATSTAPGPPTTIGQPARVFYPADHLDPIEATLAKGEVTNV
jgi:hypothetical protein